MAIMFACLYLKDVFRGKRLGPYLKTNSELYIKTNEWQTTTHDPIKSLLTRATLSVAAYARHIYFQLESAV